MTTLRMVRKAAEAIGAAVFDERIGESHSCEVEAPAGFIWKASGNHCFVDSAHRPWKPSYADLYDRIALGVEPCADPNCEWCAESAQKEPA